MDININNKFTTNFDQLLIDCNNPIINSYDKYGKYKKEYLLFTEENMKTIESLKNDLNNIKPFIQNTDNLIYYTFTDKEKEKNIKIQIKNLILKQKQYYNNFINYIMFLNKEYMNDATVKKTQLNRSTSRSSSHSSKSISRSIFTKLIPKSKTESKKVKFKLLKNPTK
jgi:hypothetical protein